MTATSTALKQIYGAARPLIAEWCNNTAELNALFMGAWKRGTIDQEWGDYRKSHPGLYLTYFIRARGIGDIKIGKSNQVRARFKTLFTGASRGLDILACYPAAASHEKELKDEFEHLRLCGEWFRPGVELLTHLQLIGVNTSNFTDTVPAHFMRHSPERLS